MFGRPTSLPWGLKIDLAHRPPNYLGSPTFQPTFLYESLWCLLVFSVIVMTERRFRFRKGQAFALYVAMYTFGRTYFEYLRSDPASRIFGVRFNGLLSAVLCIGFATWFVVLGRRPESEIAFPELRPATNDAVMNAAQTDGEQTDGEQTDRAPTSGAGEQPADGRP